MSLIQRGKIYHYDFQHEGQRYCGSTKQSVKARAQMVEAKAKAEAAQRGPVALRGKAPILAAVAKEFLAEVDARELAGTLTKSGMRDYHYGWSRLDGQPIAKMRIDRITRGTAATIQVPGSPWTVRSVQKTLARILNWAAERDIIASAPKIQRTKADGRQFRITEEIFDLLLAHMEGDCADACTIMFDCGMRPSEVMRMRWEHVNYLRGEYFNPSGKTAAARRFVPMSDRMQSVLRARRANSAGEWVFPGLVDGKHRGTVSESFTAARRAAGVDEQAVLYSLRHAFATRFLEAVELGGCGGDIGTLQRIMGHTNISTTSKYLHASHEGSADLINKRNNHRLKLVEKRA